MAPRDSYVAYGPRPTSSFTTSAGYHNYLNAGQLSNISHCIQAVSLACAHLEDMNAFMGHMIAPYERLSVVLSNKRHFDLVSETEITKARDHLSSEIAPQLTELMDKAKESLEKEERQMKALRNKTLQQQAQLEEMGIKLEPPAPPATAVPAEGTPEAAAAVKAAERELQALKKQVASLRRKRELLSKSVEKLESDVDRSEKQSR
ncbi:hypothetical protein K437DRAFT_272423 [Tilletiaria anomala UBC 951]|uniref:DASH complex subunit SPC19 n=1 Tax=Tilletiaria anomala (strain ATCC 24038 / CBS 436.72 / UBC 951) TaxID=1037660 RepID=A0A066WFJ2_TILAU|nr:uncharacterized protein K437DRAFT_272423 [Tilletiaria anomala UBC 951]KDN52561.1 hypothetical protein K437DRAFT_272423 [Tilletiaria anomala UBC 951]